MKYHVTILVTILILSVRYSFAIEPKDTSNGLEIVKTFITTNPDSSNINNLRIRLYVKNVGTSTSIVLTRNLQHEFYLNKDKPIEISINLSTSKVIEGSRVILSLPYLSPVTLAPGEIAEIIHLFSDKRDLKEIVVIYDMLNEWSDRFNTWKGRIKSVPIIIRK